MPSRDALLAEFADFYRATGFRPATNDYMNMGVEDLQRVLDGLYDAYSEYRDDMDAMLHRAAM